MTRLEQLLADLKSGDDVRAEFASTQLPGFGSNAFYALRLLRASTDVDERWWAVRALAQFPHSANLVDELINALGDQSPEVRQCAALALCHHPSPRAISSLIRALTSPDSMLSSISAQALTLIGAESVPALLAIAQTPQSRGRLEAVRALAAIKDPRAIPALMTILENDSMISAYWAEQGLNNLGLGMLYLPPQ